MNYKQFAEKIKTKYPAYKDVNNLQLSQKIIAKYPEYKDRVTFDDTPQAEAPQAETKQQYDVQEFGELSPVKAAMHGIGQGVGFGFMDELAGAVRSVGGGTYKEERDKVRAYQKALAEKYPKLSMGADIAGGVLPALFSGGLSAIGTGVLKGGAKVGAKQLAKTGIKKALATGAAYGGAAVLGYGEGEGAGGIGKDVLKGAALGAGTAGAFMGAGKLISKIPVLPKKLLGALGGMKENRLTDYMARRPEIRAVEGRNLINNKLTLDIGKKAAKVADDAQKAISKKSSESFKILANTGKKVKKKEIANIIDKNINELTERGAVGGKVESGIKALQKIKNDVLQSDAGILKRSVNAAELAQPGTEFNPVKMEIADQINKLKQARGAGNLQEELLSLKNYLADDPAADLARYANRRTGELPEVLGHGKNIFQKTGDDISAQLGYPDSETARLAYKNYKNNLERSKEVLELLRQPKREIKRLKNELKGLEGTAPEKLSKPIMTDEIPLENVKNVLWGVEGLAKDTPTYGSDKQIQNTFKKTRYDIDQILKTKSPRYKKFMKGLSKRTGEIKEIKGYMKDPDTLLSMMNQAAFGKEKVKIDAVQSFLKKQKSPAFQEIKDLITSQSFTKDMTRGGKNTYLGGFVGGAIGQLIGIPPVITAGLGALGGHVKDRYGGAASRAILDVYMDIAEKIPAQPAIYGEFSKIISKAQQRGLPALATTHAILYNKSTKYRELIDENIYKNMEKENAPRTAIPTNDKQSAPDETF